MNLDILPKTVEIKIEVEIIHQVETCKDQEALVEIGIDSLGVDHNHQIDFRDSLETIAQTEIFKDRDLVKTIEEILTDNKVEVDLSTEAHKKKKC